MDFNTGRDVQAPKSAPKHPRIPRNTPGSTGLRFEGVRSFLGRRFGGVSGRVGRGRSFRFKARLVLGCIIAVLVLLLTVSVAFALREPAYSPAPPEGEVPQYEVRGEQDFTVGNFSGRTFAVVSEAVKEDDLRKMTQKIRYENPDLDLLNVEFYTTSEKGVPDLSGDVRVANSEEALEVQHRGVSLGNFVTEEDLTELWEKEDGMDIFAFEYMLEESEQQLEEDRRELEQQLAEDQARFERESDEAAEEMDEEIKKSSRKFKKQMKAPSIDAGVPEMPRY